MKSYLVLPVCILFLLGFLNDSIPEKETATTLPENKIMMTENTTPEIPYYQIPEAPEVYNAANVAARTIDGLGYRFYWATEGLTDKELDFDPGNENRTPRELMEHFVGLSFTVLNTVKNEPNIRPAVKLDIPFAEQRKLVLENLKMASDSLRELSDEQLAQREIIFQRGEKQSAFPFWNLLNGPIADAIYHTGQVVAQRRSAGNPINPNVNVFTGKNRE